MSSANSKEKIRLDQWLFQHGFATSRHQALGLIMSANVKVNGKIQSTPGMKIPMDAQVELIAPPRYVGRGGMKLEKALTYFNIDVVGKIGLDIGASTGGFTDCLLQHGAKKVYAIDVGRGQLAWKLRQDSRVVCQEKVNARTISEKEIPEKIDICTIDVSFISVKKILPAVKNVITSTGTCVVLVKPQFEAGRKDVRKGVVKDSKIHERVIMDLMEWLTLSEWIAKGITYSPITGSEGNIEFLFHLESFWGHPQGCPQSSVIRSYGDTHRDVPIAAIVEEAHQILRGNR